VTTTGLVFVLGPPATPPAPSFWVLHRGVCNSKNNGKNRKTKSEKQAASNDDDSLFRTFSFIHVGFRPNRQDLGSSSLSALPLFGSRFGFGSEALMTRNLCAHFCSHYSIDAAAWAVFWFYVFVANVWASSFFDFRNRGEGNRKFEGNSDHFRIINICGIGRLGVFCMSLGSSKQLFWYNTSIKIY